MGLFSKKFAIGLCAVALLATRAEQSSGEWVTELLDDMGGSWSSEGTQRWDVQKGFVQGETRIGLAPSRGDGKMVLSHKAFPPIDVGGQIISGDGTSIHTKKSFHPPAVGEIVRFETCVNTVGAHKLSGMVFGIFVFDNWCSSGPTMQCWDSSDPEEKEKRRQNEFDFELIGNRETEVQLAIYNRWNENHGWADAESNTYNHNASKNHWQKIVGSDGNMNDAACYRANWSQPTPGNFQLEWSVKHVENSTYTTLKTLTGPAVPGADGRSTKLFFNAWKSHASWTIAYDQWATELNRTHQLELDWVKVSRYTP